MGFFWSRAPPTLTQEYQESIAERVRDILTGVDHSSHAQRNKLAIKALQRPEALAGVIEVLKSMPEPSPKAEGWQIDEGVDLDSDDSSIEGKNVGASEAIVSFASTAIAPLKDQKKTPSPKEDIASRPDASTVVAATTIAVAAATSATAATLAVTLGRKKGNAFRESAEADEEVVDTGLDTTKTSSMTLVKFRPAKDTVSSHSYWWGYEIFIPQEALSRIGSAQDVSSAFLGFLGSVGLVVPAIVPFLGYIAAYVGLEFAVIKAQNEGKGVILASTWLLPVALVPRAWDVPNDDQ
ncbi:hypothetical protein EMPS_03026 [Entomortierella parvispora]|uniref:Uncharacterized protein n=1 Tax=Entomortierella parvispora TaxID=205924 RepID=A0A9P3LU15_9FUNG|nr:hypothetical protein EMPS_03026 [Entomortierella parvispora]